ncbi:hypothetical protein Ccar_03595 [Clostridium carboxidivorans P7]|uniref:Uncharacterized protein n=1 Tax=Clostridium carboxidivorans P7 TaxID=536227 RepID=C6PP50_9CLOT|nr:hypothetical protein [Clostridium carboxidivorans]AKN29965.1 hypothetical protein Ccar_03595 [Clostridium carboxidivorans P7]EET88928.1 hypothetical protein CcarbDRAFT_0567 [Clostridium carboxidivorans P7]
MNWIQSNSVADLKELGSFKEVKQTIKQSTSNIIELKARGWNELYKKVAALQGVLDSLGVSIATINDKSFFTSEASEYIFYLLELDGEARLKKLKVTKTHYSNREKATKWRNDIIKVIHSDKCHHPKADEAVNKLTEIYKGMLGNEK